MAKELRGIPKKNYIILTGVIVVTILLTYYFYMWINAYNENKINKPILDKYMEVINYNELDNYITENPNSIIYVSVLEDEKIRNFEKKLKNVLKNKEMDSVILYLDITNEEKNDAMKKLNIDSNFPYLVVYTNGKITDTYSIGKNNYSTKKTIKYLNRIGADESD